MGTPVTFIGPGDTSPLTFTQAKALGLGVDIASHPDLTGTFPLAGGNLNLGMALLRRLETPRGGLFYDPDYGKDIRDLLNSDYSADRAQVDQVDIEAECLKDERVLGAACTVTFIASIFSLSVELVITTAVGAFKLVLGVSRLSITLLSLT